MARYRTKTCRDAEPIDAQQFDGSYAHAEYLSYLYAGLVWPDCTPYGNFCHALWVRTPTGIVRVTPGIWLVVEQRRLHCYRPEVFHAAYVLVDDAAEQVTSYSAAP